MLDIDALPYVPAYYRGPRPAGQKITLIGIHTTQGSEAPNGAENTAAFFASKAALDASGSVGSAHVCVDPDSAVRCVQDHERANGAAGGNNQGLHLEFCGRAEQTSSDWADPASAAELELGAQVCAAWCVRHSIPAVRLTAAEVRAGRAGFAGHAEISEAFGQSAHWDPGPNFPWDAFLARVRALIDGGEMLSDEDKAWQEAMTRRVVAEELAKQRIGERFKAIREQLAALKR